MNNSAVFRPAKGRQKAGGLQRPSTSPARARSCAAPPATSPTCASPVTAAADDVDRNHKSRSEDLTDSGAYRHNWTQLLLGTSSGLMFVLVAALAYSLYTLCCPYGSSISFAIVLSLVLHPKSLEKIFGSSIARKKCVQRMCEMQQAWIEHSTLFGIVGSLLSLRYFFSFALTQGVIFLGLNKLSLGSRWRKKTHFSAENAGWSEDDMKSAGSTRTERFVRQLLTVCIITFIAHCMVGFVFFLALHLLLFVVFATTVVLISENRFVSIMWGLWRFALLLFFLVALSYNLALDVISISDAVKRTTSAVHQQWTSEEDGSDVSSDVHTRNVSSHSGVSDPSSGSAFQEMVMTKLQQTVLKELAYTFNNTNATELANAIRSVVAPVLTQFPSEITVGFLRNKTTMMYRSLFHGGEPLRKVDWVAVAKRLQERWQPALVSATQLLVVVGSNMMGFFNSIYAFILFLCVFRYFLQLEHTVLYYVLAKMLRAFHPQEGERHAKKIERDITVSLSTLLQSFVHLSWFHFCITFCVFKMWSFPLPFISGVMAFLIALLPVCPKWFSPVGFALVYCVYHAVSTDGPLQAALDWRVWAFFLAYVISFADEWLLCVSRDLRGNSVKSASGVAREQLPTFVVCTALVLGYVSYGVRGILYGPMTLIFAKVLFDNWDIMAEQHVLPEVVTWT